MNSHFIKSVGQIFQSAKKKAIQADRNVCSTESILGRLRELGAKFGENGPPDERIREAIRFRDDLA